MSDEATTKIQTLFMFIGDGIVWKNLVRALRFNGRQMKKCKIGRKKNVRAQTGTLPLWQRFKSVMPNRTRYANLKEEIIK